MALVVYCEINRKYFFYPWLSKLNFCSRIWNIQCIYRRQTSTWLFFCGKETLCQWKWNLSFWNPLLVCNPKPLCFSPRLWVPTGVYRFCHLIFATISHGGLPCLPVSTQRLMTQGEWKLKFTLLDVVKEIDGWGHVGEAGADTVQVWTCPLIKRYLSAPCIHSFPLLMTKTPFGGINKWF